MKTIKLQELNRQYEFVCNEWVHKFCNKQKIDFDGWIGNEIGGIASFDSQYFFNLSDIILDLNTKQPKGNILSWQNEGVDFNMSNEKQHINYKSYTMGLRYEQLKIHQMNEIYINKIPTVVKTIYNGVYKKELTKEESYVAEDTYSFQIIETNFGKIALKWIEPYPFEDINEIESKIITEYER